MFQPENPRKDPRENGHTDPLQDLTTLPATFWDSCTKSIEQSREDIGLAVQEAMREKEISVYMLFERTGLSTDLIYSIIDGSYDLRDSEPISKLEEALGVRLNHL
jgi:hypothetical protein